MNQMLMRSVCILIAYACSGCAVTGPKSEDPVGAGRSPAQAQKTVEGEDAQNVYALLVSPKFGIKVNPGFEMAGLLIKDVKCARQAACPSAPTDELANFFCQFTGPDGQLSSSDSDTPIIVAALSQLTTCQPDSQGNAVLTASLLRCNSHFEADDGARGDRKFWCWIPTP